MSTRIDQYIASVRDCSDLLYLTSHRQGEEYKEVEDEDRPEDGYIKDCE